MAEMESLTESTGSELEEMDSGSEIEHSQLESGRNPLMLRKKGMELSQAFRKIMSKTEPQEKKRMKGSDDESVVSSVIRRREKEKIKKRGYYVNPFFNKEGWWRLYCLGGTEARGVVQMLNTVSRIHREKQIENKEAVSVQRTHTSKTTSADVDIEMKTEGNREDRPNWDILQDTYLEKAIDEEDWSDQSSSDVSLDTDDGRRSSSEDGTAKLFTHSK